MTFSLISKKEVNMEKTLLLLLTFQSILSLRENYFLLPNL